MDSFELTKIAGAVLSALLLIVGGKTLIEMNTGHAPAKPGYTMAAPKAAADGGHAAADAAAAPAEGAPAAAASGPAAVVAALAKASADNGKTIFSKCKACHAVEKGGPKGVGPNLWGVVNRPKGSFEGFEYSPGMKEKGGNWT
ncbi:MAG: c-type cytochrome, partial [Hyphomicrobium sp.]